MSRNEINKGVLMPIHDFEQFKSEIDFPPDIDTSSDMEVVEYIDEEGLAVKIAGQWYKPQMEIEGGEDCGGFAYVKVNDDGSISFHTLHYNGGGHWTEVVDWQLRRVLTEGGKE